METRATHSRLCPSAAWPRHGQGSPTTTSHPAVLPPGYDVASIMVLPPQLCFVRPRVSPTWRCLVYTLPCLASFTQFYVYYYESFIVILHCVYTTDHSTVLCCVQLDHLYFLDIMNKAPMKILAFFGDVFLLRYVQYKNYMIRDYRYV